MMINISFKYPSEAQRTLCHLKDLVRLTGQATEGDLYYWLEGSSGSDRLTPNHRDIDNWGWNDLSEAKVTRGRFSDAVYLELPDSKRLK